MGDHSKIEWTDATWTPVRARRRDYGQIGVHCERVSPACKNCYAATFNRRMLPNHGTGLDFTVLNREKVEIFVDEHMLLQPLRWKRGRKIFVCSQTDLFAEFVTDDMIDRVFAVIALCPQHTFQVLTKRPERMAIYLSNLAHRVEYGIRETPEIDSMQRLADGYDDGMSAAQLHDAQAYESADRVLCQMAKGVPLSNIWLGVTAENQEWADKRIPVLLQTPAAKRFVSIEPMLGAVDLWSAGMKLDGKLNVQTGERAFLNWVICGGESGHGARPMHPDWARSLRDQCQKAGVPFYFKQWGAWQNGSDEDWQGKIVLNDGRRCGVPEELDQDTRNKWPQFRPTKMAFVGKHAAGRLLDGREWNETIV